MIKYCKRIYNYKYNTLNLTQFTTIKIFTYSRYNYIPCRIYFNDIVNNILILDYGRFIQK